MVDPGELTIEEACLLVGGASHWRTHPVERLGVPQVKVTDGPNGARGEHIGDDGTPALVTPAGISLGASWDPALAEEIGALLGREAGRRGAHVLLAPTVNLHRTPVGGRTFEAFSEDPELTAALAVGYVRGVQSNGVAVTVKHLVANDTEVDRLTVDVRVDERVLRELYLRPFEAAVTEAGAWGIMTAYNRLRGDFCAANRWLLDDVLRGEWGFDGFVVSDWFGAHDTVGSARAGLDLEMPGPARIYGEHLAEEVRAGVVDEQQVRTMAGRLLALVERTGAVVRPADTPERTEVVDEELQLCRRAAAAGTVLLRNEGRALPLGAASTVAVVGPSAARTRTMGGGSASLKPISERSVLEALTDAFADVRHAPGCSLDRHAPVPDAARIVGPDGEPGLLVTYHAGPAGEGAPIASRRVSTSEIRLFGEVPDGVPLADWSIVVRGAFRCEVDGEHEVGAIVSGRPRITVGGEVVVTGTEALPRSEEWNGTLSVEQLATATGRAGGLLEIHAVWPRRTPQGTLRIGIREPVVGDPVAHAVEAATGADAAIVVVGTNDDWESEGHDRTTIALPGRQDELVRRVAAANPRTIVVVNAGSPVAMPWAEEVEAIVVGWFGGIEMAGAIADVLTGEVDPGGRLPTTFPRSLDDVAAWRWHDPVEGVQTYGEGFDVGYRGHDRTGTAPQWPFGHGLSYGEAAWGEPTVERVGGEVVVRVPLAASGDRPATVVVQGYVAPVEPPVTREPKALKAWQKLVVAPGEATEARLAFDERAFRRWDGDAGRWTVDPGRYDLLIAASAADVRATIRVDVEG